MALEKRSLYELQINPFTAIGRDWMLITAEKDGKINTMTASWGMLGVLWNKPVAQIFIRPQRYTKEFVDHNDLFTLSFFSGHKQALSILGTKSGRDCDKIAEAGLHPISVDGQPGFEEARMTLVCKKLYTDILEPQHFLDPAIAQANYPESDYHTAYIAQILNVWVQK